MALGWTLTPGRDHFAKCWMIHRAAFTKPSDSASTLEIEWLFPGYHSNLQKHTVHEKLTSKQHAQPLQCLPDILKDNCLTAQEAAWFSELCKIQFPVCLAHVCHLLLRGAELGSGPENNNEKRVDTVGVTDCPCNRSIHF